mmetsp:Transcript_21241/g.54182  ORF Transcript_21241/g.54182 Transcript_21241/m.54182 type:complete len:262 (+) Transcript_21241:100-885(+)
MAALSVAVMHEVAQCSKDCSGRGLCVGGKCLCHDGFYGEACHLTRCPEDCSGRGYCESGSCVCEVGYEGPACAALRVGKSAVSDRFTVSSDYSRLQEASDVASLRGREGLKCPVCKHGYCDESEGVCHCELGWDGPGCTLPGCCSGRGTCDSDGLCTCYKGWGGIDCSIESGEALVAAPAPALKECPNDCSGRGACLNGLCQCSHPWEGEDCNVPAGSALAQAASRHPDDCSESCSVNGRCVLGQCVCFDGFEGPTCADSL